MPRKSRPPHPKFLYVVRCFPFEKRPLQNRTFLVSQHGFKYPLRGYVSVLPGVWDPRPVCGGGLHGWAYGFGDRDVAPPVPCQSPWMLLKVHWTSSNVVLLYGKVKFRDGTVVAVGSYTYIKKLASKVPYRTKGLRYLQACDDLCGYEYVRKGFR